MNEGLVVHRKITNVNDLEHHMQIGIYLFKLADNPKRVKLKQIKIRYYHLVANLFLKST